MAARTGEEFLKGLRARPRELWLEGAKVDDVTEHPAFAGAAAALAAVFDRQHEFPDDCLMPDPATGEPINVSHIIPRSKDDLLRRHRALVRSAEVSVGLMGRTPDYLNVTFAGFAGERAAWIGADGRNTAGHDHLVAFQRQLARDDLSLTHTIIHPTVDRATDQAFAGNAVPLHKVGTTPTGSSCAGRASWRPWRRSPTSSPCTPATRCRPARRPSTRSASASRWTPPASCSCAATAPRHPAATSSTVRCRPASTSRTRS